MGRLSQKLVQVIKSPTFLTLGIFASANMLATAVSGLGGVIQARWVSPEILGEFQKYGILTSYLAILVILVQDGLMRQFPYLIGQGRRDEAIAIAATAKSWYVLAAVVVAAIFSVLSIAALVRGDLIAAAGWGTQVIASISGTYGVYLQTIYRRSMEFKRLSYNGLISSVVGFVFLIAVRCFGFYGLALKAIGQHIVRLACDARYIPIKVKMIWDRRRFVDLAKISLPLSIEGYIRTSFMTATFGFLVVRYCGAKDLGLYGIAAAFEGFAMLFVMSLMQIFDVKMANKFGESDSFEKSVKSLIVPTVLGIGCAIILAVVLCLLIGPFIRLFVPKYVDAIPVVYVLSAALPVTAAIMPTRMLRIALMYRSIYFLAILRVALLVFTVQFIPHTIEWFAGCKIGVEMVAILCGYGILWHKINKK